MRQIKISDQASGVISVLMASLIWGTLPLVINFVDGASIIKVFYRVFFAFLTISITMIASGRWRRIRAQSRRRILAYSFQGALLALNWVLFLGAFEHGSVATVELIAYTGPVFVTLLAPFVLKDSFSPLVLIPLGLSLAGVIIIMIPHGLSFDSGELTGAIMAGCSALTYAALTLRNKKILSGVDTLTFIWFEYLAASVVLLPLAIYLYIQGEGPTGMSSYLWLVIVGAFHTGVTGILFFRGLRRLRADQTAILTYMEPVSAVVLASLFLGEKLSLPTILGGLLIVIGGVIVARIDYDAGLEVLPMEVAGTPTDEGIDQLKSSDSLRHKQ